jgi:hypothetical protein
VISFLTLFLGLVTGVRQVEVSTTGSLQSVEIRLDGTRVAHATQAPWSFSVDFGQELEPHELVARSLDARGQEIAHVRQWINLPRPPAEVSLLLERDAGGRGVAVSFSSQSIVGAKPDHVSVQFDGRPIPIREPRRVVLPVYDPSVPHILSVMIDYRNIRRARYDMAVGGASDGLAKSELTAIPIVTTAPATPAVKDLQDRFQRNGQAISVTAVEHEPAEVFLVRNLSCTEAERVLWSSLFPLDARTKLDSEDITQIMWPVARQYVDGDISHDLFDDSRDFSGKSAGFLFLLTRLDYIGSFDPPRRFADAVAVAGLRAYGSHRRRAVVLAVSAADRDESLHQPAAVRQYLSRLRVPLYVWSLAHRGAQNPAAAVWGVFDEISSTAALERAVERLRQDLARQSIVWLGGQYLPQEISMTENGDRVTLVH